MKFVVILAILLFGSVNALRNATANTYHSSLASAAELYSKNCASCHGKDGRAKTIKGRLKHARDLTDGQWQARVTDERIFNSIINGKGKMPSFSKKLTEQEIDSLVTHVRALKK
jgi:mono/diheme cytochrome c family protein